MEILENIRSSYIPQQADQGGRHTIVAPDFSPRQIFNAGDNQPAIYKMGLVRPSHPCQIFQGAGSAEKLTDGMKLRATYCYGSAARSGGSPIPDLSPHAPFSHYPKLDTTPWFTTAGGNTAVIAGFAAPRETDQGIDRIFVFVEIFGTTDFYCLTNSMVIDCSDGDFDDKELVFDEYITGAVNSLITGLPLPQGYLERPPASRGVASDQGLAFWFYGGVRTDRNATNAQTLDVENVVGTIGMEFTGSGLNDMIRGGFFNGSAASGASLPDHNYYVEIDGVATPDTFKWSNDGGSTFEATAVAITGSHQTLENGVTVKFRATTGHTLADRWEFDPYGPRCQAGARAKIRLNITPPLTAANGASATDLEWKRGSAALPIDDVVFYVQIAATGSPDTFRANHDYGVLSQTVGSGLHDLTWSGNHTGADADTYTIKISSAGGGAGGVDQFQWKKNAGAFSSDVDVTGAAQTLSDGVSVTFAATTGHTLNDEFQITAWNVSATNITSAWLEDGGSQIAAFKFAATTGHAQYESWQFTATQQYWNYENDEVLWKTLYAREMSGGSPTGDYQRIGIVWDIDKIRDNMQELWIYSKYTGPTITGCTDFYFAAAKDHLFRTSYIPQGAGGQPLLSLGSFSPDLSVKLTSEAGQEIRKVVVAEDYKFVITNESILLARGGLAPGDPSATWTDRIIDRHGGTLAERSVALSPYNELHYIGVDGHRIVGPTTVDPIDARLAVSELFRTYIDETTITNIVGVYSLKLRAYIFANFDVDGNSGRTDFAMYHERTQSYWLFTGLAIRSLLEYTNDDNQRQILAGLSNGKWVELFDDDAAERTFDGSAQTCIWRLGMFDFQTPNRKQFVNVYIGVKNLPTSWSVTTKVYYANDSDDSTLPTPSSVATAQTELEFAKSIPQGAGRFVGLEVTGTQNTFPEEIHSLNFKVEETED